MLLPKKTKYRKVRKGKNDGIATRGHYVAFGDYGLQSQSNNDITSRQIESASPMFIISLCQRHAPTQSACPATMEIPARRMTCGW